MEDIKSEIEELKEEIDRILMSTSFNTAKLLAEEDDNDEVVDEYVNDCIVLIHVLHKKKVIDNEAYFSMFLFVLLSSGPQHLITDLVFNCYLGVTKELANRKILDDSNIFKLQYLSSYHTKYLEKAR